MQIEPTGYISSKFKDNSVGVDIVTLFTIRLPALAKLNLSLVVVL